MPTFFVAADSVVPPTVRITGPLLHHLRQSLRLQPGETLTVTDDAGNTATTTQAVTIATDSPGGLTAAFTFSPTAPLEDTAVNFNASTSTSADPITNYKWDFGDGDTASTAAKTTSHTFDDPGTYVVTLTVVDPLGRTASSSQSVTVAPGVIPTAAFTSSPAAPSVNQVVNFNGRASTAAPGRSIVSYSWDFGDGSSGTGLGVSHAFSSAGVFNVTLTVTSLTGGTTASVTKPVRIAVPPAPTAVLTMNPLSPAAGQSIVFSSVSVLPLGVSISRHVWTIDSVAVDTGTTSSYTHAGGFAAATSHQVTLTITDNYGRTSRSTATTIDIP